MSQITAQPGPRQPLVLADPPVEIGGDDDIEAHARKLPRGASMTRDIVLAKSGSLARVATVVFTPNLKRHVECPTEVVDGSTVRAVLDAVFAKNPRLRGYVLDDQGGLRYHMNVFVDGEQIADRARLSDPVRAHSEIYVMQALSGG